MCHEVGFLLRELADYDALQTLHRQQHVVRGDARGRRELVVQRAADHALDDRVDGGVGERVRRDVATVA